MSIVPATLLVPFIVLLGSCTTIYNVSDNRVYDHTEIDISYDERMNSSKSVYHVQQHQPPKVVNMPQALPAPVQVAAKCSIYTVRKIEQVSLTKEEILSAKSERDLVDLVMKHSKSLEARIIEHNKGLDLHNKALRECQSN